MTIRATDMQIITQKVGDVSRIQHTQKADHDAKQSQFAQQINQETRKTSKTVKDLQHTENIVIHDEEEQKKKDKKKKKKNLIGKESDETEAKDKKPAEEGIKGNRLDIRA